MLAYRRYLLRATGRISRARAVEVLGDAEVAAIAQEEFKMSKECPVIEIWEGSRLVARLGTTDSH
jgi:hypothetical protein